MFHSKISYLLLVPMFLIFVSGASGQTLAQQEPQNAIDLSKSAPQAANSDNSLKELSTYYEREAERIAKENDQLRILYKDGLIARNDLEANDRALAAARSKVEDIHRQLAAALAPVPVPVLPAFAGSTEIWTTGNRKIDELIHNHGKLYGVDPYLIFCVMSQESSFQYGAVSGKGAQGLMQLMPGTAARYGVSNPFDPAQSIRGGTRYLKDLLNLFDGRIDLTLAAYNAGEGTVIKYGNRVPPYAETQSYVRLISKRYLKKVGS
jgi:soluble lytic murein transglycosylase-like protein